MVQIDNEYVGQMIQEVREQRKIQQKDLAERIKVTQPVMSKIEGGKQAVDIQTLVHISEILNVRLEYLLGIDRDIDDDTHVMNLFIKKFFRIITGKKFFKGKKVFASESFEDFFYSANGHYVILEGPKREFALIKEVAIANGHGKAERDKRINKAFDKYRNAEDKNSDKYFLLSKQDLQKLVKEYVNWEKARMELAEMQEQKNIDE